MAIVRWQWPGARPIRFGRPHTRELPPVKLTEFSTYTDAQRHYSSAKLWELFDGTRERLNLAHECIDRHATSPDRVAVRIAFADGHDQHITFERLKTLSSQVAHFLTSRGVGQGDRVAIMLEPSLVFYAGLFGAIKTGAIAVPLFGVHRKMAELGDDVEVLDQPFQYARY